MVLAPVRSSNRVTPRAQMSTFSLVHMMLDIGTSPEATASTGGSRTTCSHAQGYLGHYVLAWSPAETFIQCRAWPVPKKALLCTGMACNELNRDIKKEAHI